MKKITRVLFFLSVFTQILLSQEDIEKMNKLGYIGDTYLKTQEDYGKVLFINEGNLALSKAANTGFAVLKEASIKLPFCGITGSEISVLFDEKRFSSGEYFYKINLHQLKKCH